MADDVVVKLRADLSHPEIQVERMQTLLHDLRDIQRRARLAERVLVALCKDFEVKIDG